MNLSSNDPFAVTEFRPSIFEFKWAIKNMSLCPLKSGDLLESPVYTSAEQRQWCLHLYPSGHDETNRDYLGLFLNLLNPNQLTAKQAFAVANGQGQPANVVKSQSRQFQVDVPWGYKQFVARSRLLDHTDPLLIDDSLTVICKIESVNQLVTTSVSTPIQGHLARDLCRLLTNQLSSDIAFLVGGREFKAIRGVLAARSSVFQSLFEFLDDDDPDVLMEINDTSPAVFEELLRYVYTDWVEPTLDVDKIKELWIAADRYELDHLKCLCVQLMTDDLSVRNSADVLIFADRHHVRPLKSAAMGFIKMHYSNVVVTTGWKLVRKDHNHLVSQIEEMSASRSII